MKNCIYCNEALENIADDFCTDRCEDSWVADADAYWEECWENSLEHEGVSVSWWEGADDIWD